ncbi:MAG: YccF domain-containing protein [Acetobacteraceae bacterium]|jgi:uncharacterized membrane protein YccF (DUF307 family)
MRTILNILWNVPGLGFVAALLWVVAGVVMAITIIGLPWAKACFTLANYTLAPFGRELVARYDATGRWSAGSGGLGLLANIIWFVLAGWWLAVMHVVAACACAITIIGIPFAWAHLKIAAAALAPVGKIVVPVEVAVEIDREKAAGWLYGTRRR